MHGGDRAASPVAEQHGHAVGIPHRQQQRGRSGVQSVYAPVKGRQRQAAARVAVVGKAHRKAVRLVRAADPRNRQPEHGGRARVVFQYVFGRVAQPAAPLREIERCEHARRDAAAAQRKQMRHAVRVQQRRGQILYAGFMPDKSFGHNRSFPV